MQACKPGSVS